MVVNVHCAMCTPAKAPGSAQQNKSSAQNAEHLLYETFRAVRIGLNCAKNLGRNYIFLSRLFFLKKNSFPFTFSVFCFHPRITIVTSSHHEWFRRDEFLFFRYSVHCTLFTQYITVQLVPASFIYIKCRRSSSPETAKASRFRHLSQNKIPREKL